MSARARAWTALAIPPVAWFLFEQGLSHVLHVRCDWVWLGFGWGAASLGACALAAWLARPLVRSTGDESLLANPWLARLALVVAGIFGLAVTFQTLAIAMVPPCVR